MPPTSLALLIALGIGVLADVLFAGIWFPPYFRVGLRLHDRRFPAKPASPWPLPYYELESEFTSGLTYSIAFRPLSDTQYAFREKFIQMRLFNYTPFMHGLLTWEHRHACVHIKGYVNWSLLVFMTIWCAGLIAGALEKGPDVLLGILPFVAFMALLYAFQAYIYNDIGRYAARRWSEIRVAWGADA